MAKKSVDKLSSILKDISDLKHDDKSREFYLPIIKYKLLSNNLITNNILNILRKEIDTDSKAQKFFGETFKPKYNKKMKTTSNMTYYKSESNTHTLFINPYKEIELQDIIDITEDHNITNKTSSILYTSEKFNETRNIDLNIKTYNKIVESNINDKAIRDKFMFNVDIILDTNIDTVTKIGNEFKKVILLNRRKMLEKKKDLKGLKLTIYKEDKDKKEYTQEKNLHTLSDLKRYLNHIEKEIKNLEYKDLNQLYTNFISYKLPTDESTILEDLIKNLFDKDIINLKKDIDELDDLFFEKGVNYMRQSKINNYNINFKEVLTDCNDSINVVEMSNKMSVPLYSIYTRIDWFCKITKSIEVTLKIDYNGDVKVKRIKDLDYSEFESLLMIDDLKIFIDLNKKIFTHGDNWLKKNSEEDLKLWYESYKELNRCMDKLEEKQLSIEVHFPSI